LSFFLGCLLCGGCILFCLCLFLQFIIGVGGCPIYIKFPVMTYRKMIISGDLHEIIEYEKIPNSKHLSHASDISRGRALLPVRHRRPDNVRAQKRALMRRVRAKIAISGAPLFISVTFSDAIKGFGESALGEGFLHDFVVWLRKTGYDVSYVAVPEFQDKNKRGTLHYHALVWGLPMSLGDVRKGRKVLSYGYERIFRFVSACWGQGFADVVRTDGSTKLAHYLSKYFTKAWLDRRFDGHRVVYYSIGFPLPVTVHNEGDDSILNLPLDDIKNIMHLGEVDNYKVRSPFHGEIKVTRYSTYLWK